MKKDESNNNSRGEAFNEMLRRAMKGSGQENAESSPANGQTDDEPAFAEPIYRADEIDEADEPLPPKGKKAKHGKKMRPETRLQRGKKRRSGRRKTRKNAHAAPSGISPTKTRISTYRCAVCSAATSSVASASGARLAISSCFAFWPSSTSATAMPTSARKSAAKTSASSSTTANLRRSPSPAN